MTLTQIVRVAAEAMRGASTLTRGSRGSCPCRDATRCPAMRGVALYWPETGRLDFGPLPECPACYGGGSTE